MSTGLLDNGFNVVTATDSSAARKVFFRDVLPNMKANGMFWGDSVTLKVTGVLDKLLQNSSINLIQTFEEGVEKRKLLERHRQTVLTDLFLIGGNTVIKDGKIINLAMIGIRTAPISFGPKKLILFIDRNKICTDMVSAMAWVKTIAAPSNAKRHQMQTPCTQTGRCHHAARRNGSATACRSSAKVSQRSHHGNSD
ncbi:LUD domain-containing protein [Malonomonas rubra]|uniref:LUD domain-containing protein n=1 Tax=Malonomonas rubra TaxID=57040 RepID=UPI0026EAF929|nr:LUD domain-containing protein [Malonomonas rubra]